MDTNLRGAGGAAGVTFGAGDGAGDDAGSRMIYLKI